MPACPGVAPFDQRWGLVGRRSSPGVRRLVSFLSARLTHEEVAETLARLLPLAISARQVGHVIQPAGEAFRQFEDQQVQKLLMQGAEKHRSEKELQEEHGESMRRLYVEMDGVMARLRRESVPMEAHEQQREGDAYREVKVGAVFVGEPGPERSDLVPGVLIDRPVSIKCSGIAEAACKTVVATRTKRSGMRWTPQGLDAILALRTAALNQEFNQSWQACREAV